VSLTGLDLDRVAERLAVAGVDPAGPLTAELIAGGRSNLTYRINDGVSSWVLRRPPLAGLTPGAHDVAREHRIATALSGTDVPIAEPVLLCEDQEVIGAPFTVVAYVHGRTFRTRDDLETLTDVEVRSAAAALVEVLASLHRLVPSDVGLGTFGRPGYVARQIDLWRRQWELVATGPSADLERLHTRLRDRLPAERPLAIVHGDYRIDNTLIDPRDAGCVRAVVDWEMAALGDARADLAMTCIYRHPAFDFVVGQPAAATSDRFESADAMAHHYATVTSDDLGDWPFYRALAAYKLAVIAAGIRHRADAGGGDDSVPDDVARAVPELLEFGLDLLTRSPASALRR
jgi:aminoglycoside phosphotransferase (APT) family kinase protein